MSSPTISLFTAAALEILDRRIHDAGERGFFDLMSGALVWADEFPRTGSPGWWTVAEHGRARALVAYRAS